MSKLNLISKTNYKRADDCETKLAYYSSHYDIVSKVDADTEEFFNQGNKFNSCIMKDFERNFKNENCVEIQRNPWEYLESVKDTQEALAEGKKVIFEASFYDNQKDSEAKPRGAFIKADILIVNQDGSFNIYENKRSKEEKKEHYFDVGYQVRCIEEAGYTVKNIYLNLSVKYTKLPGHTEKDVNSKIYRTVDVTEKTREFLAKNKESITKNIERYIVVKASQAGVKTLSQQCAKCECRTLCLKNVAPEFGVLEVLTGSWRTKAKLVKENKFMIEDISENDKIDTKETIDLKCHLKEKELLKKVDTGSLTEEELNKKKADIVRESSHINNSAIKNFLSAVKFPVYSLDYETFNTVVPIFDNTYSGQQVVFEASIHRLDKDGTITHDLILIDEKRDGRKDIVDFVIEKLGSEGSVIAYNKTFEEGINNELGNTFPDKADSLLKINERFLDNMVVFKDRMFYSPVQKTSFSLKYTGTAMVGKNYYEHLAVKNGSEAYINYSKFLTGELSDRLVKGFLEGLRVYNGVDTILPVAQLAKLMILVDENTEFWAKAYDDSIEILEKLTQK